MRLNLTVDGEIFSANLDWSTNEILVPCDGCASCGKRKRFAPSKEADGTFELCPQKPACIKGNYVRAKVKVNGSPLADHVVCVKDMAYVFSSRMEPALLGIKERKFSLCWRDDASLTSDFVTAPPCDTGYLATVPNMGDLIVFDTHMGSKKVRTYLTLDSRESYAPRAALAACHNYIFYKDLDLKIPCDRLKPDAAYRIGWEALKHKRLFFEPPFVGIIDDVDCTSVYTLTTSPTLTPTRFSFRATDPPASQPSEALVIFVIAAFVIGLASAWICREDPRRKYKRLTSVA